MLHVNDRKQNKQFIFNTHNILNPTENKRIKLQN